MQDGKERQNRDELGSYRSNQVKDNGLDKGRRCGCKKGSNSYYLLKVEPIGFPDKLGVA